MDKFLSVTFAAAVNNAPYILTFPQHRPWADAYQALDDIKAELQEQERIQKELAQKEAEAQEALAQADKVEAEDGSKE